MQNDVVYFLQLRKLVTQVDEAVRRHRVVDELRHHPSGATPAADGCASPFDH